jgi:acyl carrier protein
VGVFDVIVSADSGSAMHAMLARLSAGGRYIDLCPRAGFERPELGALRLGANRSVSAIDIGEMIRTEPTLVLALLEQTAEDAISGRIRPIETTEFSVSEGARALRFMAQNRHIGRICMDLSDARQAQIRPDVKPGTELAGRGVFVVGGIAAGGITDAGIPPVAIELEIGPAIANWLRDQGADDVMELGSGNPDELIASLRERGLRLGGWIHVASEADRGLGGIPPCLTAGPIDFCALVSVREPLGDDRARNRAWESRLMLDRLLLSSTGDVGRSLSVSVGRDVDPQRVIRLLELAILEGLPESQIVMLSDDDLSERLAEAPSPILSELRLGSESRQRSHLLRAELLSLTPSARRTTMQRFVCDALASVLGLSEEQRLAIDVGSQLDEVGLDSLMTMELFMGLGRGLDLDIAAGWFDSVPSLAAIAAVLVERLEEAASAAGDS